MSRAVEKLGDGFQLRMEVHYIDKHGVRAWYAKKRSEQRGGGAKRELALKQKRISFRTPSEDVRVAFESKNGKTIERDAEVGSPRLARLLKRRAARIISHPPSPRLI